MDFGCSERGLLFVAMCGLLRPWLLLLQGRGSRRQTQQLRLVGSAVVMHELSCSTACGIFLDQGSNPCPLAGRFFTTGLPEKSFFKKKKKKIYIYLFLAASGLR